MFLDSITTKFSFQIIVNLIFYHCSENFETALKILNRILALKIIHCVWTHSDLFIVGINSDWQILMTFHPIHAKQSVGPQLLWNPSGTSHSLTVQRTHPRHLVWHCSQILLSRLVSETITSQGKNLKSNTEFSIWHFF